MFDEKFVQVNVTQKVIVRYKDGLTEEYLPEAVDSIWLNCDAVNCVVFVKGGENND